MAKKVANKDSADEQPKAGVRKPYKAPSIRFQSVFEVSALSCGKISGTQASCHHSRKAS
jgi:hypothetical protein